MKQETISTRIERSKSALSAYLERLDYRGYTIDAKAFSEYNILYYLHLAHSIGKQIDGPFNLLEELAQTQDENGFLAPAPSSFVKGLHDDMYIRLHQSGLFFQLVDLYGFDVRLPKLDRVFPEARLKTYLEYLDYTNIWLHSNVLLGVATASQFCARRGKNDSHRQILIEYLSKTEKDFSGLWGCGAGASLLNSIAGTFHLVPILVNAGIFPSSPIKVASKVLSMQTPEGLFCAPHGYSCIEYDCIYLLKIITDYCQNAPSDLLNRIRCGAAKAVVGLLNLQNPDGGFPDIGRGQGLMESIINVFVPVLHHRDLPTFGWNMRKLIRLILFRSKPIFNNSVEACAALPHQSNVFSSWFRYLSLRMAAELAGFRSMAGVGTMPLVGLNYFPAQQ